MFLHEQIQSLKRRIKNIEENPRPEFLRSNKLRYELELESYLDIIEAWKEGKPFAILMNVEQLAEPLGFKHQGFIEWGDRVRDPQRYYNIAVNKLGFPEHTCDRTMSSLGLFLSGEVPVPRLIVGRRVPCDPERWSVMAAAKYAGCLFYDLSRLISNDYENIRCLGEQLAELVEFAEKSIPGIKYDESKLIEMLEMEQTAMNYQIETYNLRKQVPCPISPQDSFRLRPMVSRYPNPAKAVEYCRIYRDELFERAAKGTAGVKDEKLRIAWLATGPYGRATFDLLARKGVSLPWFHYGAAAHYFGVVPNNYGDDSIYGHKLTPLEEVVRPWNANTWAGTADAWVDPLIKICRELKIDAVIDFLQVGCIITKNLKRITSQRLKDELGIPTLDLEGRELYATQAGQVEMNKKLEDFLDICIANRGLSLKDCGITAKL